MAHIFEGTCGPLVDSTLLFNKVVVAPLFFNSISLQKAEYRTTKRKAKENVDHFLTQ